MIIGVYKDNLAAGRGADIAVKNFAAAMASRGHEVKLFDRGGFAAALARKYDVLVATGSNELVDLAAKYPCEFPCPVVLQLHIHPKALFKSAFLKLKKWIFNRALKRALGRVAVQVLMAGQVSVMRTILGDYSPKVVAIGNALSSLPSLGTDSLGIAPYIVYPASLEPLKQQDLLIKAFAKTATDFPRWQLHLYGRGKPKYEAELRALITKLGQKHRILLKGYGDLGAAYDGCAFAAQTSKIEGFGLTVIEASAHAKPTVCTEAVAELVEDGVTGLVSEADSNSLASALCKLMRSPELVSRQGAAARHKVIDAFAPDIIFAKWEDLLRSVCLERPI